MSSDEIHPTRSVPLSSRPACVTHQLDSVDWNQPTVGLINEIFVSASHQTGLYPRSMTWRSIIAGGYRRGRSGTSRGLSPAWLCCSWIHLLQCGLDQPSWKWTQIWVHVRMPDYSLKWTTGSSAIQEWQWCSSLNWRWPSWSWGHCGLMSTIDI